MACESSNQPIVEFYLSSLWSWLPEGRKRILEALESCDLAQAHFTWDEKYDWFHIQCLEDDKDYIMNEYLKAQGEMESELREKDVLWDGGDLIPTAENDLIEAPRPRAASPDESDDSEVSASPERVHTQCSDGQGRVEKRMERRAAKQEEVFAF